MLGWTAITGTAPAEAWLLALIIFVWTPPHFWALALYRLDDYRKSGLPMLPVTHGERLTRLHIFLYTVVLVATTALPFVIQMSGYLYLAAALALGRSSSATRGACIATTATGWRAAPSTTRSSTWRRCSRRCWSITT